MVTPSCPVLVVFEDDQFRRELIKKLDENHFSVTYVSDGDEAVRALDHHSNFRVIIVGLDLKGGKGTRTVSHLRDHREVIKCGVLIVGEPDPALRTYAPWADETLLKPVDPAYVMTRALTYCNC